MSKSLPEFPSPVVVSNAFKDAYRDKPTSEIRKIQHEIRTGAFADVINTDTVRCMVLGGLALLLVQRQVSIVG